jgi:hypothetical protein
MAPMVPRPSIIPVNIISTTHYPLSVVFRNELNYIAGLYLRRHTVFSVKI